MQFGELTQIITTLGFPIFSCCAMGWYVKYATDKHRQQIDELNAQHKQELLEVTEALNNNTIALTRLCDKLGG